MARPAPLATSPSAEDVLSGVLDARELVLDPIERRALSGDVYSEGVLADAVVRCTDRERLARAVAAATSAGFAIVPRGGGMSYTGGYLPQRPRTIIVDLSGFDRILEVSAEDLYITVEAGVTWKQIYEALKPLDLRLPFFGTFSGAKATVGGGLSNGALFLGTARYGTAADCMLGMQVLLADGTLLRTGQGAFRNVRKPFYRTFGPDLSGLFVHDTGAFGLKLEATFRLIRMPRHSGYASFIFEGMTAAGRALSEVARTGAAEEAYVFDPETTRKNLATGSLRGDAQTVLNVVRGGASLLKGLKEGAQLVAAGRDFLPADAFSLHVVCTGRSESAMQEDLAACRTACLELGGTEVANSIPKAVRANLFPAPDAVLGPRGDRWAALNAKVAHSDAERIIRASAAALQPYETQMREAGVWMSHLLIAIGTNAFSFEPVFHWFDEWLPMHERTVAPAVLAGFERPAPNAAARDLVEKLRRVLVDVFTECGAASNQIGKTYTYLEALEPGTANLVAALKDAVDGKRAMNPGALGLR